MKDAYQQICRDNACSSHYNSTSLYAKSAFSTTEALIGVTVAIVLGIITYFALSSSNNTASQTQTLRKLQQWGIALNLYINDNQNKYVLPGTGSSTTIHDDKDAWFNALPPYLSQEGLADRQPADMPLVGKPSLFVNPAAKGPRGVVVPFTYGMNAWLDPKGDGAYDIYSIENPGDVVFLAEVETESPRIVPDNVIGRFAASNPLSPKAVAHFLFTDGHVAAYPRSQFIDDPASTDSKQPSQELTWVPFIGAPAPTN